MRKKLATSHEGKYSYWLDKDLYIYQRNEETGQWIGWLCSITPWENTFSRASWITLEAAA